jgi:hypothetical protein
MPAAGPERSRLSDAEWMRLPPGQATKESQKNRITGVAGGLGRLEARLDFTYSRTGYGRH